MYVIIGRPEMEKYYLYKDSKTKYYELNKESEALIRKWAKRRTRKNGTHEIKDRGLMARVRINALCKKYGYSYTTMHTILSRSEFSKYRDVQGRLIIWNDEAEQRLLKIMELKEKVK
jgi:predicted DNA-binding WGR domain protein